MVVGGARKKEVVLLGSAESYWVLLGSENQWLVISYQSSVFSGQFFGRKSGHNKASLE